MVLLLVGAYAASCTTFHGLGQVTEMTDDEYQEWVTASTQEVAAYASAALDEGDLQIADLQRFTEELDQGIWGVVQANGYAGLALQQLLWNYKQTLADKGIDPIHATARFSQYTKALSAQLKALLPQE